MQRTLLGVMSGTSLDGVDLCLARFEGPSYRILEARTLPYSPEWKRRLAHAHTLSAVDFVHLHGQYGRLLGTLCKDFLKTCGTDAEAIASHGHTVFHQPQRQLTFQLGDGAYIAAEAGRDCIFDFRKLDVALHGQGAPLVPIGDANLFSEYRYCLNLGGFSNLSTQTNQERVAYDICAVNLVLNHFCTGLPEGYDDQGKTARRGTVHSECLDRLNRLPFYQMQGCKSLGREWVESEIIPILAAFPLELPDVLATYTEHAAQQIGRALREPGSCLTTGGGAWNTYLLERIQAHTKAKIIRPDAQVVDFKEALIFAYLGYLFLSNQTNTLRSVTGALNDSIGGILCKSPRINCS